MAGPFRLARGGNIDRTKPLTFTLDGRAIVGLEGDTVSSALLGAGVSTIGRGLKFHRPRGVLSAGLEEPNALLTLGEGAEREPSVRATVAPLREGLVARTQNCWPNVELDFGRLNDVLYRLFPAGFYNKTFMWPSWHAFEPAIRRMAGLGVAPNGPDRDRYEWRNAHCDVLVVGGGVAGMLAAALAARSAARVLLLESDGRLGGALNWHRDRESVGAGAAEQLLRTAGVRVLLRTTAVGIYDNRLVTAIEKTDGRCRERWWRIRASRIILASGAFEQPLAFPFNDRPGIMLADAVRHYLNRYAVAAGKRVVVATNNDTAYQVALDLRAAGITVPCLLDTRPTLETSGLADSVRASGVDVFQSARILETGGNPRISSVQFATPGANGGSIVSRVECDALAMSGGWNPAAHLYCQAGGKLHFDTHHACLVPGALDSMLAVGSAAGCFDMHAALDDTRTKLEGMLREIRLQISPSEEMWRALPTSATRAATGALGYTEREHRDRTWLDFQHDVTVSDIDLAVRENLVSVEHVKRYTTVGMSIDQGKTSNLNAIAVLARCLNQTIPEVGTTTFRPMFVPVTLGAIAGGRIGRFYRPKRLLPAHDQHEALGAHFEDYGSWQRPACYPKGDESHLQAIHREVRAVRSNVGLYDASPLGKFLVRGPDAAQFLDRMYANVVSTLRPGRARYGLMLNESGVVIDDGVCTRLSASDFWVNTTSGGATRMAGWFDEWLQGEWPSLQVVVTDVTSQWATFNLAGPNARNVLAGLPSDLDLSPEAFPHLHLRSGRLCGVPCQILRVSFSGELSYEISVPANFGASMWERILEAGASLGITPFGVESLLLMRTEKGYLHVGSDTDGTTVPDDLGFGSAIAQKSGDFVGRRSLTLPENVRTDRLQFVGLRCIDNAEAFVAGAHILDAPCVALPQRTSGYLTSATFSPTLGHHVGLGLVRSGRARVGQTVHVFDGGRQSRAMVVSPSHYDATGARLRG